jgi:hypothetical protein
LYYKAEGGDESLKKVGVGMTVFGVLFMVLCVCVQIGDLVDVYNRE